MHYQHHITQPHKQCCNSRRSSQGGYRMAIIFKRKPRKDLFDVSNRCVPNPRKQKIFCSLALCSQHHRLCCKGEREASRIKYQWYFGIRGPSLIPSPTRAVGASGVRKRIFSRFVHALGGARPAAMPNAIGYLLIWGKRAAT